MNCTNIVIKLSSFPGFLQMNLCRPELFSPQRNFLVTPRIDDKKWITVRNRSSQLFSMSMDFLSNPQTFEWEAGSTSWSTELHTQSTSRSCTASRSTLGPCRPGSTAPCSSPPHRSHSGSCWARLRSSWWTWLAGPWPSRRSYPRRQDQCPMSRSARCRILK